MAEWLRRVIRNHMGVARGSSNLSAVVLTFLFVSCAACKTLKLSMQDSELTPRSQSLNKASMA